MPTAVIPYEGQVPQLARPKIDIGFRLLRDGEVTTSLKYLRLYRDWSDLAPLVVFVALAGQGEFTQINRVDLSTMLSRPDWLVAGVDDTPPRKTRATYVSISAGGVITFNITSGDGGGQQGEPGWVDAAVRVSGLPGNREVVLVERPADGEWRLAGYGSTPGGNGHVEGSFIGGEVYALSLDDFGDAFAPNLEVQVGQRVRPSVFAGVLYQVTEAGVLPATEPEWWPITSEGSHELGTARAEAVRYYRPLAHGPVTAEPS